MPPTILGLGGLLSDPAWCVLKNGQLAAAVEQAKVSRRARENGFPEESLQAVLDTAQIRAEEVNVVAVARPLAEGPESAAQLDLRARFPQSEIVVIDHHLAHASSAFYASGLENASVISVDRAGDYRSAVLYEGEGLLLTPVREMYFPDSLGDLYNRATELLGFEARSDEHKVQWLSASGHPRYLEVFRKILHQDGTGWPRFDRTYFDTDRLRQGRFSLKFFEECGLRPGEPIPPASRADLASSLQNAVSEVVIQMLGEAQNVCLAGGLGLNALLVHKLEDQFRTVFVQPAAGNAGTALGAAFRVWHQFCGKAEAVPFQTLSLGPEYAPAEIKKVLENCKLNFQFLVTESKVVEQAVRVLSDQKIVAWMQGRMEFGPRALGNRSILASPSNPYSTENLNIYIKHREAFRKFAASVPEELAGKYFEIRSNAAYLATVGRVRPEYKTTFSAALMGDDLVRVHTVSRNRNPLYHHLLMATGEASGMPVLYNTSFNLFGDPLVCTTRDAVRSFYSSGIDALFVGSFYVEK